MQDSLQVFFDFMTSYVVGSLPPPPEGTRYVLRQAGGHHEQNGDNLAIPNLEHDDGSFLKLYRAPQRGANELAFYQRVFNNECRDGTLISLRSFVPNFNGIYTANFHGTDVQFLKVEDITRRFQRPCILDIKLKADVHDPYSHSSHPIYNFAQKYSFLIDGIQVYHKITNRYISFGKSFGRWLDEDGVQRGLLTFLNADCGLDEFLICAFLERLEKIKTWASQQCHFSFYRSSLLLVYDALDHPTFNRDEGVAITDIRMVDFAKVYPSNEADLKYENAISNFIQHLRNLLPCRK